MRVGPQCGISCSDIDTHMRELAAGLISGFKHKVNVTLWVEDTTLVTQHLPATCLALLPVGWGWPCPDALGPPAGLSCTAAGRLRQQSASGARGKPIPSLLNEALVSQSLPSGGGGRLEPHSERCQACCQQPSAQMEAGDKEHALSHPGPAPLPFLPVLEMNKCKIAGSCPGYHLQSYPRNGI